jgi:cytochrome b6-f complex subunit 4
MGHNSYGEPAWPNDILYIFPICIMGLISVLLCLGVLSPERVRDDSDPFATPNVLAPDWYLLPTFTIIRLVTNKGVGMGAIAGLPFGLASLSLAEGANSYQNPYRRPLSTLVFLLGLGGCISLAAGCSVSTAQVLGLGLISS